MKKIAYYLRNSTDHQDYVYQKEALDGYLNTFNNVEFVGEFAEKISGFKSESDRPEMNRLLSYVEQNLIDEIWCYDVARLSRDAINLQNIVKTCTEKKVNIYFKANNLYTLNSDLAQNDTTKLIVAILAQFAETDAKQLIQKMKFGKQTKNRMGNQFIGGMLRLGYNYKNDFAKKTKDLYVDEKRRFLVEYIFNQYVNENKSLNQIANQLNILRNMDEKYLTDTEYRNVNFRQKKVRWCGSSIRDILKSTWYIGFKEINKRSKTNEIEKIILPDGLKIIDLEIWQKAQEKLSKNKNRGVERVHTYLLKDSMFCECGEKMVSLHLTRKAGVKVGNYICLDNLKTKHDRTTRCKFNTKSIKCEPLENAVWNLIKYKLSDFKLEVSKKTKKAEDIDYEIQNINEFIHTIETVEINELENQKQRAINLNIKHNINVDSQLKEIENNIKAQNKLIGQKKTEISELKISIINLNVADEIEKNIKRIEKNKSLIKKYINKIIDRVVVCGGMKNTKTNVIELYFKKELNYKNIFLIFNSDLTINSNYYFIKEIKGISKIEWNYQRVVFEITVNEDNSVTELSCKDVINYMKPFYDEVLDEMEPESSYVMLTKEYFIFTKIICGQSKIKIISPFI